MNTPNLNLNTQKLLELMKDFYLLTGIKIVIFDNEYNEILSYPESHCNFCALMHGNPVTRQKCIESNERSFQKCRKTEKLEIYHCHAGLVEATAPLVDNNVVIGYIMFGQIADFDTKEELINKIGTVTEYYKLTVPKNGPNIYNITQKTSEQILAAAKILEACTFYVLLTDMVSLRRQNFMNNVNTFLMEHLSEDLSIERLMEEFQVSRNKLYDSTTGYLGVGIAEHIRNLRINEAKRLLAETNLPVHVISDKVGFNDYNYFCRIFKRMTGVPAKQYRKQNT